MSGTHQEAYEKARQEIEELRLENSKLREQWLEATDALLSYTDYQDICIGLMPR
jgi:hypothetical protein